MKGQVEGVLSVFTVESDEGFLSASCASHVKDWGSGQKRGFWKRTFTSHKWREGSIWKRNTYTIEGLRTPNGTSFCVRVPSCLFLLLKFVSSRVSDRRCGPRHTFGWVGYVSKHIEDGQASRTVSKNGPRTSFVTCNVPYSHPLFFPVPSCSLTFLYFY